MKPTIIILDDIETVTAHLKEIAAAQGMRGEMMVAAFECMTEPSHAESAEELKMVLGEIREKHECELREMLRTTKEHSWAENNEVVMKMPVHRRTASRPHNAPIAGRNY